MLSDIKAYIMDLVALTRIEPWVLHIFIVVLLTLLLSYVVHLVLRRIQKKSEQSRLFWDDALIRALRKPLILLIWLLGLTYAAGLAQEESDSAVFELIGPVREIGFIVVVAWFLNRFIKILGGSFIDKKLDEDAKFDRTTIDAIVMLLTVSVLITAFLVILQSLGYSISGVLAFGGIGGIAVAFAAKDLLSNFFGGLLIYMDRPFSAGDWIRSPDREIEGIVEKIGWRLTQIRTFDKRPLYIPNYVFNTVSVENPSRMSNRRIFETVGVRYDDAAKIRAIITDVRTMIENHDDIDHNQTLIVNFDKFAASSLNFFIYTFTKTTIWVEYHAVKQDVLLRVIDIIEQHGAECAFPTSTVHIPNGIPAPADLETDNQSNGSAAGSEKRQNDRGATPGRDDNPRYGDADGGGDGS